jgi:hypothetical protein
LEEDYDVYYTDQYGNYNVNGAYITFRMTGYNGHSNIHTGLNIDAVALIFSTDGGHHEAWRKYATQVTHFVLGTGLSGAYLSNNGYATNALGHEDGQTTYMGDWWTTNTGSYLTVGFC